MARRPAAITLEQAESLAIEGLQFIAADPAQLGRFLDLTGLSPSDLRELAASDDFLSGILDYFMGDEATLLAFAASRDVDPAAIGQARALLSRDRGAS